MYKILLRIHFLSLLFLLSVLEINAQQTKIYDSIYQPAAGITGEAQFQYYLNDKKERIKNGNFLFERETRDSLSTNTATYNRWEGDYAENVKTGVWEYETKSHRIAIEEVSELNLEYSIYTEDEILKIDYLNGFPNGEISLESTLYIDRERVKTLKYFSAKILEGKLDGKFEFILANKENDLYSVIGEVNNGLMTGVWEFHFFEENITETREYDRGILLRLTREKEDESLTTEFPLSEELKATLNNEESDVELVNKPLSLTFSDGYARNSKYIKVQKKGEEILRMIFNEIFQYDESININEQLPLGTNRGFYQLSSEEQDALENWAVVETRYRENIQQLQNLKIDNVDFIEDANLQTTLKWAEKQEEIEEYIQPWNNILSKDQAAYYNRKGLLVDYTYNILSTDTIKVNEEEMVIEYKPRKKGDNFLTFIVENFKDRNRVGDSLIHKFSNQMEELELDQEISEINSQIATVDQVVDSLYQKEPEHRQIRNTLYNTKSHYYKNIFSDEFDAFANMADEARQLETGREIIINLELLENIYHNGLNISKRHSKLDSLYTEYTFDPFTYSDQVPVRKKKRLYNLVTDDIINRIIDRANSSYLNPKEVLKNLQLAYQMQERLIFLEDKNTEKLERRLRRSDNLEERIELLNSL